MFSEAKYLLIMFYTGFSRRPLDSVPALYKVDQGFCYFRFIDILRDNYATQNFFKIGGGCLYVHDSMQTMITIPMEPENGCHRIIRNLQNDPIEIFYNSDKELLVMDTSHYYLKIKPMYAEDDESAKLLYETCMEELKNEFR